MNDILFYDKSGEKLVVTIQKIGKKYIHAGNMKFNKNSFKLKKNFDGCLDGKIFVENFN